MIADWHTYAIEDFIPFTTETYVRLMERQNEALWPWHALTFMVAVAILVLLAKAHGRWAGVLCGGIWGWVGYAFHMERYSSLNWAADYFGWAFIVQGLLLAVCGLCGGLRVTRYAWPEWLGSVLAVFGLLFYPLLVALTGRGWTGSEWVAIAPDPTVIFTFGIILLAVRGWWLCPLLIVPIIWCGISGATLWALETSPGLLPPMLALLALTGAVGRGFSKGRASLSENMS